MEQPTKSFLEMVWELEGTNHVCSVTKLFDLWSHIALSEPPGQIAE